MALNNEKVSQQPARKQKSVWRSVFFFSWSFQSQGKSEAGFQKLLIYFKECQEFVAILLSICLIVLSQQNVQSHLSSGKNKTDDNDQTSTPFIVKYVETDQQRVSDISEFSVCFVAMDQFQMPDFSLSQVHCPNVPPGWIPG